MGFGTQAWELLLVAARADGIQEIQLEVRGDNEFAIDFYRRRGLEIIMPLEGYYQAGIGYVMRGNI
jgi:ribosomal protein S18 acetylase RimI-like enzyme